MKIEDTNDHLFRWLESQKWQYVEWFNDGIEVVSLGELYKQSAIKANAIESYLRRSRYELNTYTYKLDPTYDRIVRTSPKIKKPDETRLGFTLRKIKEVLN